MRMGLLLSSHPLSRCEEKVARNSAAVDIPCSVVVEVALFFVFSLVTRSCRLWWWRGWGCAVVMVGFAQLWWLALRNCGRWLCAIVVVVCKKYDLTVWRVCPYRPP